MRPPGRDEPATRRILRVVGVALASVIALLLVSTAANAALEHNERAQSSYGERIRIGDGFLNVYREGTTGPTIVMLTGYGMAAPALDFAPLIRELDGYRLVVVEGFGYGRSDTDAPPRTIENITSELHAALAEVGVDEPYVLMGHSIAGLYTLYYANRYRDEVAAVVGIDASVPGQINGLAGAGSPLDALVAKTGLLRLATTIMPSIAEPEGDAFTAREREQIRLMTNWNHGNAAVADEANQGARNFAMVEDLTYPEDLPVLSFVKAEGNQPGWRELHEIQLDAVDRGELVELDGGHYLHWTHSAEIADEVGEFLNGVPEPG
ncbi:alpha/beta fold hydrolase [Naasia sp. SYSU D00948]|uniref:alpha/beta fold hydrolase n=1 Tax=Naasia sp. SYSU D00948 TaxID=2817379 RepID=UPI001B308A15|nr:alpha/beta hydrolase [Naasia sp. SYSU D00948]